MTPGMRTVPLGGWGRYPVLDCRVTTPSRTGDAVAAVRVADEVISRGRGRSYGDASLNPSFTLDATRLDRILAFDPATGAIECEAGLSLEDLLAAFVPRGWFVPVTPGTRFVTIGGMIAADVHGKNHHNDGSFCDHLAWVELALHGGEEIRCSRDQNPDLFAATCGGMGLTGLILRAAFTLRRIATSTIRQQVVRAANLDAAIDAIEQAIDRTYSVAWIDCLATGRNLGRSIVFLGDHCEADNGADDAPGDAPTWLEPRRRSITFDLPALSLNSLSVRAFNTVYFGTHRSGERRIDLQPFFYPLDAIQHWNRIYGSRGFVQYQCVLPLATSRDGLAALLAEIAAEGSASFLTVLKRMGPESFGLLSFPMPGFTLALDFPVGPRVFALLARLDRITLAAGGRCYLAKDARMTPQTLAQSYPRLEEFREVRRHWGLDKTFASALSRRLQI